MNAEDLRIGEQVQRLDGSYGVVVALRHIFGVAVRYNLTVADDHTYAVGAAAVVVHNNDGCGNIADKVNAALSSTNPGTKLEGQVAEHLGDQVTKFQEVIRYPSGAAAGDIDVETEKAIIEVTGKRAGKIGQLTKYLTNTLMNPDGKAVILYAPNYLGSAAQDVAALNIPVARNFDELDTILAGL